jgi:hypothetical protein
LASGFKDAASENTCGLFMLQTRKRSSEARRALRDGSFGAPLPKGPGDPRTILQLRRKKNMSNEDVSAWRTIEDIKIASVSGRAFGYEAASLYVARIADAIGEFGDL